MAKNESGDAKIAVALLGVAAIILLVPMVLRGLVLSVLWKWFLVPLGIPEIGIAHGVGICGVVGFLKGQSPRKELEDEEKFIKDSVYAIVGSFLFPAVSLACGYIVHLCM